LREEKEKNITRGDWLELTWRHHLNMKYSGRNSIHNTTRTTNQQQTQFQKEIPSDDFDGIPGK
jgi:hypothetical protein